MKDPSNKNTTNLKWKKILIVVNFTYIQVKRSCIENAYREWYKRNKVGKEKKDL